MINVIVMIRDQFEVPSFNGKPKAPARAVHSRRRLAVKRARSALHALLLLIATTSTARSQDQPPANVPGDDKQASLQFAFEGAPWRGVLGWLADEADLALHVGETPTGSFTYSDRRPYTPDEAINRVNQFLIPKGFSLVRSGKLLSVISVEDTRSLKQLDVMAKLVSVEELATRGDYDVVKCLFPLGKTDPETAVRELSAVTLMMQPIQLPRTNQLLITDTAGKLRTAQKIIATLKDPATDLDRVKTLQLDNIDAEAALAVIRPHVGLEGDTLIGGDIRLSTDASGKTLFVSGTKEQVDTVEALVETLKKPIESKDDSAKPTLQRHSVKGADLQTVYDVLQTLLAGEDLRLSLESTTKSIIARGPQRIHDTIKETIATLEGSTVEFKIIDLKTVDPYYAVSLVNEMFGTPASDDPAAATTDQLKIDADPIKMRLFVRAKPAQIEQIEELIEQLASTSLERESLRLLPYYGNRGQRVLDTARNFWPGQNPVLVLPHGLQFEVPERAVHPRQTEEQNSPPPARDSESQPPPNSTRRGVAETAIRFASQEADAPPPSKRPTLIRSQLTPRGILIQSDDLDALDRFEEHLRMIAGPAEGLPTQSVVYYLKYTPVGEATRMLSELLGGTPTTTDNLFGSLISGSPTQAVESGAAVNRSRRNEEHVTTTAGTATIITDARLNRLIVLGTDADIALVERYLPIIDKETSLTDMQTDGTPRVIPLIHTRAEDTAAIIRDAYSGRIASTAKERQQAALQAQRQQQQRNPQNQNQRVPQNQPQQNRPATSPASSEEPKFTLAVDSRSNSLIVTAPKQLADEVEQLAKHVDTNGAQTISVISLKGGASTQYVREALEGLLSDQVRARPTATGPRPPTR